MHSIHQRDRLQSIGWTAHQRVTRHISTGHEPISSGSSGGYIQLVLISTEIWLKVTISVDSVLKSLALQIFLASCWSLARTIFSSQLSISPPKRFAYCWRHGRGGELWIFPWLGIVPHIPPTFLIRYRSILLVAVQTVGVVEGEIMRECESYR